MSKYTVQVRKANREWLDGETFTWKWLASLYAAKMFRLGWETRPKADTTQNKEVK